MKRIGLYRQQLRSPLARRLIFAIILVSSAITLCLTTLQLYGEYRDEMGEIQTAFRQIDQVHLTSLSQSLWATNEDDLKLQVAGIVRLPNLEYIAVREGDRVWAQAGRRASRDVIERQYAMTFWHRGGTLKIGTLTVVAGLDAVYHRLLNRAISVLASNALKTFLVAGFAFLFFHGLVNRHLLAIAEYLRGLDPNGRAPSLVLARPTGRQPDELDEVSAAINQLQENVSSTLATLRENQARLGALTRRLLEAQETERRSIARELHDEVGGVLTAVKLNLLSLQGKRAGAAGQAAFTDSLALVDGAIQTVRSLSLALRPAVLDDLGLIPALKWYCERQAQRAGIAIELSLDAIDLKSAPQLEIACFRIVQESVTNALRHARARCIQVALRRADDGFELEIADNGGGFEVAAARRKGHSGENSGLLGMEERTKLLGGRLTIDSTPGAGARVRVQFAVPEGGFA